MTAFLALIQRRLIQWTMTGLVLAVPSFVLAGHQQVSAKESCGEVITLNTHSRTSTRYTLSGNATNGSLPVLVLMVGGGGHLDLNEAGCPQFLKGNSLVRMQPLFHQAGMATALVDSPSDYSGTLGLGGFRQSLEHAQDIGRIVEDVRRRLGRSVWLVGTSRGSISAANAASRLSGNALPDGLILTSIVTNGNPRGNQPWQAQTVFDLPLAAIKMPALLIGHEADSCERSPARLMPDVAARIGSAVKQVSLISGGPFPVGKVPSLIACEGKAPHGFAGQEAEVVAAIVEFVRSVGKAASKVAVTTGLQSRSAYE